MHLWNSTVDFLVAHPVLIYLLGSGACLLSSRQDVKAGCTREGIFWQVLAIFALVCGVVTLVLYHMWFNATVALAALAGEIWLAKRWWWSDEFPFHSRGEPRGSKP
jgi:hypothetical protein